LAQQRGHIKMDPHAYHRNAGIDAREMSFVRIFSEHTNFCIDEAISAVGC
jgi:hypothetical protein